MFRFIANLFACENTLNQSVHTDSSISNVPVNSSNSEEFELHMPRKIPACSYCSATSHNIIKCDQVKAQLEQIKTYCSNPAHQADVIGTTTWLKTFDNKVLARYIIINNINSYMWNNCAIYYANNINKTNGKDKNIQLIIGYECVLPAHPEIRIKRTQLVKNKKYNESNKYNQPQNYYDPYGTGLFEKALIMNAGIATGVAISQLR